LDRPNKFLLSKTDFCSAKLIFVQQFMFWLSQFFLAQPSLFWLSQAYLDRAKLILAQQN